MSTAEKELLEEEQDAAPKKESPMAALIKDTPTRPMLGDVVEGPVIAIGRARVYVNLHPFGTGIIYGREYLSARDTLKNVHVGDTITAKIVDTENKDGYIELSLREARQALIWGEAEMAMTQKTIFELPVTDANKGGLIIEWQGIQGFLPASQLAPEHYPRVADGDKDKIFEELKKLIGITLPVSIITASPKEQKLIFSEKGGESSERTSLVEKYRVGDVIEGEVTGATDFGVFVKLEEGLEGLVHISEMDWGLVEDPKARYKIGDAVKVKVIEIKDDKVSLSIKALVEDPWKAAADKYKKGERVNGVIIKYNKHGALASIEEGVAGLVHISEFKDEEALRAALELGKAYPFVITLFEPKDRRMTLSFNEANKA
ncbi:MAG TPA: S1 RNA-binding domain-containing protein [Candidatus Paceibacterota bacterium]|nr:S1 RNA-binding domain-containing protein [Candidatus Paceibacterota bacterium]